MGAGIFTMHYLGMSALHASAHMQHAPLFVGASMAVAIGASGLALWLATGRGGRPPLLLSAVAFGMAVSGMHYTAMEGVALFSHAGPSSSAPALSTDLLAIVVAIVAFCVSAIFLLFLVPDHSAAVPVQTSAAAPLAQSAAPVVAADGHGENPDLGRGGYAPLGGAGGPPRRFARHLPIERDGAKHVVAVDDVVAIHANAHYTYIYNGQQKLFCPLAIGDVEARLDGDRFVRVHRSHIVNIDRVLGHRRSGDNELVEMEAAEHYAVPVSRSRVGWLKSRVAAMAAGEASRRRQHLAAQ
jgi:hypothetical protein